jgi:hypothetical protein
MLLNRRIRQTTPLGKQNLKQRARRKTLLGKASLEKNNQRTIKLRTPYNQVFRGALLVAACEKP